MSPHSDPDIKVGFVPGSEEFHEDPEGERTVQELSCRLLWLQFLKNVRPPGL